jgi:hypothetical protein
MNQDRGYFAGREKARFTEPIGATSQGFRASPANIAQEPHEVPGHARFFGDMKDRAVEAEGASIVQDQSPYR